ncbi:MAG: DUF1801 domain-containing protein [Ignavibacteria bacterium]|nr:DUF1801 domain-containing protein [Ignavibacteria bacterium]
MTQSDEQHQAPSHSSSPAEGGSSDSEGRNRRRRRRGGRRGDGQSQEPREGADRRPAQGGDDDRPTVSHADTRIDRGSERPAETSEGRPEADGTGGGADADRKRKRRRKKRSGSEPQGQNAGGEDQQQASDADGQAPAAPSQGQPQREQQPREQQPREQQPRGGGRPGDRRREPAEKKERAPRGSVLQRRVTRGEYNDAPVQKEEPVVVAPINAVNVDAYIAHHKGWQREVLTTLRSIIRSAAGEIDESILWSQPVFSMNGPVCYLKAFTDHVNFGFWRGTELEDPDGLLVGDLTKMRHITLRSTNDVKRDLFESMVRQAVRLNRDKGDPTLS